MNNLKSIELIDNFKIPTYVLEKVNDDELIFKRCVKDAKIKSEKFTKSVYISLLILLAVVLFIMFTFDSGNINIGIFLILACLTLPCSYLIKISNALFLKNEVKKVNLNGTLIPNSANPDFYKFLCYNDGDYVYEIRKKNAIENNWITFELASGVKYFANKDGDICKIDSRYIINEYNKEILESNNEKYQYQINVFNRYGDEILCEDYPISELKYCY